MNKKTIKHGCIDDYHPFDLNPTSIDFKEMKKNYKLEISAQRFGYDDFQAPEYPAGAAGEVFITSQPKILYVEIPTQFPGYSAREW